MTDTWPIETFLIYDNLYLFLFICGYIRVINLVTSREHQAIGGIAIIRKVQGTLPSVFSLYIYLLTIYIYILYIYMVIFNIKKWSILCKNIPKTHKRLYDVPARPVIQNFDTPTEYCTEMKSWFLKRGYPENITITRWRELIFWKKVIKDLWI